MGSFGFTKSVSHQGEKVQIKLPDFSGPEAAMSISCAHCPKKFKNNQGYAVHLKWIHLYKEELVKTLPINTFKDKKEDIRATVLSVMEKLVSNVEEAIIEGDTKAEKTISNRRGRERRGKYTVLFKAKVISDFQPDVLQEQLAEKYCIRRHKKNMSLSSFFLKIDAGRGFFLLFIIFLCNFFMRTCIERVLFIWKFDSRTWYNIEMFEKTVVCVLCTVGGGG